MTTMALNKGIDDYCEGIKNLILDIKKEIEDEVKDGIGMKLSAQKGDEVSAYNFLKNQGYEIAYKDFLVFYEDSMILVDDNQEILQSILEENQTEELSDNDLEIVAGGKGWWKKNWKKVAIGVGIGLVVAAVVVATGGIAGVVAAGGAAAAAGGTGGAVGAAYAAAIGGAAVSGYISAGLAAAGIISITAGVTE